MTELLLEDAEPYSHRQGTHGVLLIHGFTSQPHTMRSLATAFACAGYLVELPRLPGHGTTVADLENRRFPDWTAFVEGALADLRGRARKIVVVGLSMGGTLACWLCEHHRDIAGLILINPLIEQTSAENLERLHHELEEERATYPNNRSDIKDPRQSGFGYGETPIRPLLSALEGAEEVAGHLDEIVAPILMFTSREDHVVPPSSGDTIVERVRSHVERVYLENSYHVATLDYDAPELEERAVAFARKVV